MTCVNQPSSKIGSLPIVPTFEREPTAIHAGTILHFLQEAIGSTFSPWLAPVIPFSQQVPAFSGNILEVHLGKEENNVDFAVRVNASFDKELLTGLKNLNYQLPFADDNLSTLITSATDGFIHGIENIWIEYDAPFQGVPALFFDIHRSANFSPEQAYDCLQQIAKAFYFRPAPFVLQFLKQVQQQGLYVAYYGFMFSRNSESVRLTINGIEPEQLAKTLYNLGWRGNSQALEKLSSTYLKKGQKLVVGVDVGNKVGDRIGIEVFEENKTYFIEQLYNHQLLYKDSYQLLTTWENSFTLPKDLRSALTMLYNRPVYKLYTRLNHFKFVIDASENLAVKSYLYYCF